MGQEVIDPTHAGIENQLVSDQNSFPAAETLLHTKLFIPPLCTTLLSRPRLTSQLGSQSNAYLTLLSAPAGFGKTTLVTDWMRQQQGAAAWLTLDEHDNDPVLFWRYLTTALQAVDARLGLRAQAMLGSPGQPSLETAVTLLINDIVTLIPVAAPIILILDDYHCIQSGGIHQSLNYLLQHQPRQLHLILLTRADPPLSLARLRVEGRLVELRAADLRLSQPETATFLTEVMALPIPTETLDLLME